MSGQTRTCPACGRENDADGDFCACGEYLRWEPTTHLAAVDPPPKPEAAATTSSPPEHPAAAAAEAGPAVPHRPGPPTTGVAPSAAITLRLPDDAGTTAGVGMLEVGVVPGDQVRIIARIRNQSTVVDNYDLELQGLPPNWSTITPATVYLVPFGSSGTFEQDVDIILHPARAPEAEARRWELRLTANSRAQGAVAGSVPVVLGILPYEEYQAKVKPQRASGRRRATLELAVDNRANAPVTVALGATDADGECRFRFDERLLEVPPGRRATTRLRVRPRRQIWLGRRRERSLEVTAATGEEGEKLLAQDPGKAQGRRGGPKLPGEVPKLPGVQAPNLQQGDIQLGPGGIDVRMPQMRGPQARGLNVRQPQLDLGQLRMPGSRGAAAPPQPLLPSQAVFVQKAWLPWWLAIVVPLLVVAALALVLLLPSNVTVPDLRGAPSKFEAQQRLTKAGLKIDANDQQVITGKVKPGTVLGQDPGPGKKVHKGSAVSVQVAVGTGKQKVPSIVGQTFQAAEIRLRRAGFDIGKSSVQPPDLKAKIASQIPLAGDQAPTGAPIDIFYAESKPPTGKGAGGVIAPGSGGAAVIPAIDPPDAKGYGAKLSSAGLVPKIVRRFSDAKPGTVFGVDPGPGTGLKAGASVNVLVSAGIPRLVYDDDQNVLVIDGATGKRIGAVAKSPKREKDPTFSADGREVVFTEGGQLMSASVSPLGGQASALTPTGMTYADPSFAPTSEASVLASARVNDPATHADTDLCLGKVTEDAYQPECIVDKHFAVGFAHWSPDGRTLLMLGVSAKGFGIVRYRSKVAFSPRAESWGTGHFVTPRPDVDTGVADAALAPDGKHLAAVANLDTKQFQLYLTTPGDLSLKKATPLPVVGCKIAWRPDGQELVVVQAGADCRQDAGQMLRVPIDKPTAVVPLVARGDNPTYQPLQPGG